MRQAKRPVRILYSFPNPLGSGRIADTAWYQVKEVDAAGGRFDVFTSSNYRPLPESVRMHTTLSLGRVRVPFRLLGRPRAFAFHDWMTARYLRKHSHEIDVVHTWPIASLRTLRTARELGIPSLLERPNAHTRYAYEVVQKECERLGVSLPPGHEHAYNAEILRMEEEEYELAARLLCPSDFVVRTFQERGFASDKLVRHRYGYDEVFYYPPSVPRIPGKGLRVLFVGVCAVRKGLHFALEAWLRSSAHQSGTFQIAGTFVPAYAERLSGLLAHHSIQVLGHRSDIADLMRQNDVLVLPSIEEGSALVTSEARGSGCVLAVSDASGANCTHMENALVHRVGDVEALAQHFNLLSTNRELLEKLRAASMRTAHETTWRAAGTRLLQIYEEVAEAKAQMVPVLD